MPVCEFTEIIMYHTNYDFLTVLLPQGANFLGSKSAKMPGGHTFLGKKNIGGLKVPEF